MSIKHVKNDSGIARGAAAEGHLGVALGVDAAVRGLGGHGREGLQSQRAPVALKERKEHT